MMVLGGCIRLSFFGYRHVAVSTGSTTSMQINRRELREWLDKIIEKLFELFSLISGIKFCSKIQVFQVEIKG